MSWAGSLCSKPDRWETLTCPGCVTPAAASTFASAEFFDPTGLSGRFLVQLSFLTPRHIEEARWGLYEVDEAEKPVRAVCGFHESVDDPDVQDLH
jgi:hypothetical protein